MKRRDFLQKLGGTFFIAAISPTVLNAFKNPKTIKNNNHIENEVWDNDDWDEATKKWTEAFFKYLKNNDVGFEWERVYSPIFEVRNGRICQLGCYFNILWNSGGMCKINNTGTLFQGKTLEEYRKHVFNTICHHISKNVMGKLYIYQIHLAPITYDALNNFRPIRHISVRGIEA